MFNPFYAHLAAKLCSFDYNYKFTLQYAFWDKFKQLPSLPVLTISNLGMFGVKQFAAVINPPQVSSSSSSSSLIFLVRLG